MLNPHIYISSHLHIYSLFCRMNFLRLLLLPFSLLYGAAVMVRNFLFDVNILRSEKFPLPVISVGNLTAGGSGKTPHTEYLVRLLRKDYKVATLSRGYGRKSKGFILVSSPSTVEKIGDEPMQYLNKFSDIIVSVCEKRVEGIRKLMNLPSPPKVILLDDAFQHRWVKPGLSLLLMEYDDVLKPNYLLPAGTLREPRSSMKRADVIIITKSPEILVSIERKRITDQIILKENQQLFFSYLTYGDFIRLYGKDGPMMFGKKYYLEKRYSILLVTGIVNPSPLIEHLRRHTDKLFHERFPDHYNYKLKDIERIQKIFENIANPNKIIVTTEKDAMRLKTPELEDAVKNLPIFYLPVQVEFHQQDKKQFDNLVLEYVQWEIRKINGIEEVAIFPYPLHPFKYF